MKMFAPYLLALVLLVVGIYLTTEHFEEIAREETRRELRGSSQDTFELLKRLAPLSKDPTSPYYYSNGITVEFHSNGKVMITMRARNDNKYAAEGYTLKEAAANLSAPSNEIIKALEGWANH